MMTTQAPASRPNVLVFFTDQQRWDTTGIHGNPVGLTPNFDRMARTGTDVHYSFTCQPVCGPARACLQTGRYATTTGVYRNAIGLSSEQRTLAHYFRDAGYTTAYIGKWHLALKDPVPEERRGGYQDWLATNRFEGTANAYDTVLYDSDGKAIQLPGYRVDALTDAAIRYLDTDRRQPFFLFISYIEPHQQPGGADYLPPDGYRDLYNGAWTPPDLAALGGSSQIHLGGYYGMVKRLDEALGRILDALKSLGQLDNTIVLFTSDHGNHFQTRNGEYKRSCHESSIRVPTALQGPGFNGGGRINELVSLIDLPPTLLAAAGIPVPPIMQGRSILPLIKQEAVVWPQEVFIQISETQIGRAIRTKRWKYSVQAPNGGGNKRPAAARYVEDCLYDLHADPTELFNLVRVESFRPIAAQLRQRLIARMVAAGETPPIIDTLPDLTTVDALL